MRIVVNDSATFLGTAYSQALSDEIDLLGAHNILFVTAAGNTGDDNDDPSVRRYPCGYDRPTEICVTASNQSDQLPTWANYGANTVDLAARGVTSTRPRPVGRPIRQRRVDGRAQVAGTTP